MLKKSVFPGVARAVKASTFRKVVLVFLLLLVPLYAMSFLVYERSYRLVQDDIFSSHQTQIRNYMQVLENDVAYIRSQQLNLVNDAELNALGFLYDNMDLYDIVLAERSVQEKLETLRAGSPYVEDATVWLLAGGISISGKHGVSPLTQTDYDFIRRCTEKPAAPIAVYAGVPYMVVLSPYLMDLGETPPSETEAVALIVELDFQPFTNTIRRGEPHYDTDAFLSFSGAEELEGAAGQAGAPLAERVAAEHAGEDSGSLRLEYEGLPYIVSYQRSQALDALLLSYMPEENIFAPLHFYRGWLAVFLVLSILIVGAFAAVVYVMMHRPLHVLLGAFRRVEGGELTAAIGHRAPDEFAYIYDGFNRMLSTIRRLNREVYEQTILMQQAELKQLQQKINPHFLYNAFFSISTVSRAEGCDTASRLAQRLGQYFRFVTKEASEQVALSRELEYAQIYAEIQEMRFSNRISIEMEALPRPALADLRLPALLLQPLIENALEHGLKNKLAGGVICVGFRESGGRLMIFVEDNGDELTAQRLEEIRQARIYAPSAAGALSNIYRRLRIVFGDACAMRAARAGRGGLRIEIEIPAACGSDVQTV